MWQSDALCSGLLAGAGVDSVLSGVKGRGLHKCDVGDFGGVTGESKQRE